MKTKFTKKMLSLFLAVIMVISALPFTAVTASAADPTQHDNNEVFGNVTIDPIVYVHGTYTGSVSDVSDKKQFDYMMNGSIVADGTYDGEFKTYVTSTKTISRITVVDTGKELSLSSISGGTVLSGDLGGSYSSVTPTDNLDSTVTLKFEFNNSSNYEYHRLAVKANPVAQHALVFANRAQAGGWSRNIAFEVLAYQSYGQNNAGTYSLNTTKNINHQKGSTNNYIVMYAPHNSTFDCYDSNWITYIDGFDRDHILSPDKKSGYGATGQRSGTNTALQITANSAAATYYIDKSATKNYGVDKSGDKYRIKMLLGSLYVASGKTDYKTTKVSRSMSNATQVAIENKTSNPVDDDNSFRRDKGALAYITYELNSLLNGTNTFNYETTYKGINNNGDAAYVTGTINMPVNVIVSDKTTIRNQYNKYISDLKNGTIDLRCVTSATKSDFINALLAVEEYLNDNTDTSDGSSLLSNLNSKYNLLEYNHTSVSSNNGVKATCTTAGLTDGYKCSVCGKDMTAQTTIPAKGHSYTGTSRHIDAKGENNGYTEYLCKNGCNEYGGRVYDAVDWSTYDAAVTTANDISSMTAKYTAESLEEYNEEVEAVTSTVERSNTKSQSYIDSKVTAIEEAQDLLVVRAYTLTFTTLEDSTNTEKTVELDKTEYKYGDVVVLSTADLGIDLPYKWTKSVSVDGVDIGDSKIANATDTVSVVITGDTNVVAYYGDKTTSADQKAVKIYNRNGKVAECLNVNNGSEFTFDGSKITIGSESYTLAKIPYYQVIGYKIDGTVYDSNYTGGYNVTSDIEIFPVYQAQSTISITLVSDGIKFNNSDARVKTVNYNELVKITSDSDVIWKANDVSVARGTEYVFRASNSMDITVESVEAETGSSTITFGAYDAESNCINLAVSSYKSTNYVIKEQGVLVATSKSTTSEATQDVVISKGRKYIATKNTDTGDQFSYRLSLPENTTIKTVCVVSYVIYDNGAEAYSAVKTIRL